jgi:hypothetical protein
MRLRRVKPSRPNSPDNSKATAWDELRDILRASKLFLSLFVLFALIAVLVLAGIGYTAPEFRTILLKRDGNLLDGLLANGVSIIISTILITPLTAYFVELRRERRLGPARASIVRAIAEAVNRLARNELSYQRWLGQWLSILSTSVEGTGLRVMMERLAVSLQVRNRKWLGQPNPGPETKTSENEILVGLLRDCKDLLAMSDRHYDVLYKETDNVDRSLTLCMLVVPPAAVSELHEIQKHLFDYKNSLLALLGVLRGSTDIETLHTAKSTKIDFRFLMDRISALAAYCPGLNLSPAELSVVSLLTDKDGPYEMQRFAEQFVELIEQARRYDASTTEIFRDKREPA